MKIDWVHIIQYRDRSEELEVRLETIPTAYLDGVLNASFVAVNREDGTVQRRLLLEIDATDIEFRTERY